VPELVAAAAVVVVLQVPPLSAVEAVTTARALAWTQSKLVEAAALAQEQEQE
jgi:hypothetical protein